MNRSEIRERIVRESASLPDDVLLEVADFMEFVASRRAQKATKLPAPIDLEEWKTDFRSVSVWSEQDDDIKVASWQIESF